MPLFAAVRQSGELALLDPEIHVHAMKCPDCRPVGTAEFPEFRQDDPRAASEVARQRIGDGLQRPTQRGGDPPSEHDDLRVRSRGGLWVAMWNGAAVQRYDRDGRLTATIPLPVTNVTSCAFGGSGGTTLFVTTSRDQIPSGAGAEPLAGRVFELDAGVRGAPVHSFAG
ncbi:MAG: hypothetical protein DSY74_06670 [Actinobacteria bacterium]|nr:MAG: hypothetical protein DSY74_06670 [Actinomycetota bacterium]